MQEVSENCDDSIFAHGLNDETEMDKLCSFNWTRSALGYLVVITLRTVTGSDYRFTHSL